MPKCQIQLHIIVNGLAQTDDVNSIFKAKTPDIQYNGIHHNDI
jgi:hypothetical protein